MKKITPLFSTIGLLFLITSCSTNDKRHSELIDYLDSGSHYFSLDASLAADDAAIIELLAEASKFNEYVIDSMINDSIRGDAKDFLRNSIAFNNYLRKNEMVDTDPIILTAASTYHQNYINARSRASEHDIIGDEIREDSTEAILFTLPMLISAYKDGFNPNMFTWGSPNWWEGKGFFIFLANYGSTGHGNPGPAGSDMWQTSSILQLARDVPDTNTATYIRDNWAVIENQLYNFGDLKPPKIRISNYNLAPK